MLISNSVFFRSRNRNKIFHSFTNSIALHEVRTQNEIVRKRANRTNEFDCAIDSLYACHKNRLALEIWNATRRSTAIERVSLFSRRESNSTVYQSNGGCMRRCGHNVNIDISSYSHCRHTRARAGVRENGPRSDRDQTATCMRRLQQQQQEQTNMINKSRLIWLGHIRLAHNFQALHPSHLACDGNNGRLKKIIF